MESTTLALQDPFEVPSDPKSAPRSTRAVLAFEMRKAGAPWELIAEKLGYASGDSCRMAVLDRIKKYYKASTAEIEEIIGLEHARLDQLQLVCWRAAKDGDLSAVDRILKIMERRAKLLGLDKAPDTSSGGDTNTVNNTAVFIGGTEEQYIAAIQQARELAASTG